MTVPSYDDLAPGIPDVIDSEKVDQLVLFLKRDLHTSPEDQDARRSGPEKPDTSWSSELLVSCLRLQQPDGDLQALLTVARDFSPRVMRVSDTEVLLDVSGLGRLIGPPDEIARQLARALDVPARVALAPTQTAARLMATQPPGFPISRLAGLPVDLLQPLETLPPATNPRDRARIYETLARWGITTLGELAALPAASLSSRLGRRGVALQRLARGLDATPFVPDGETPRYVGRLELEWPIDALEPLSFVLARLLEPLSAALERADRGAAAVHLALRLTDRSTDTRVLQLPAPMRDPRVLRTLLLLDLESHPLFAAAGERRSDPPRRGASDVMIDVVAIELDPAPARITQFSLLQRALPSPETLSTLTARLSALAGDSRVGSPALVDSHRADAFAMTRYAPEGAQGTKRADADGAGADSTVLRRRRPPLAIRVSVEHGRPMHIAASRRGIPYGAILQAAGPWRTSGAWWTDRPWNHNEWDVALKTGALCRIFQDRTTACWFLEGIYD